MAAFFKVYSQDSSAVLPSKSQLAWADCEIGVIIHLDINIFDPDHFDYKNKETCPPLTCFNPSKLNTDQWIKAAKDAGSQHQYADRHGH
jgi:alpha-L-fucosidase